MRETARSQRKAPFRSNISTDSIPAPTAGWDAISALASMDPDRAVQLDNWIPRPGWIEPRRGYIQWATGMTDPVETLMPYYGDTTVDDKLFAIAGDTIYDVTDTGAAVATTVTTLTSARCQYTTFTNTSGLIYLVVCNGVDTPRIYDGSTWATMSITGPTSSTFVQPFVYAGRLWFVAEGATVTKIYYLALGAISGAATGFEVGPYMSLGGYVNSVASWSVDTRQTVNDYMAIISSRGEVIVYVGTDPSSANTWQLVGRYMLGRPIGRRCATKIGGDLAIITVDGVTSMNTMLLADRTGGIKGSITARILGAVNAATSAYHQNYGWQLLAHPHESIAILNIPISTNTEQMQFVRNNLTGAWCRFLGINANHWELFQDDAYFGGNDGIVYLWNYDAADDGEPINCTAKFAWNYMRSRGYSKRFTLIRPVITSDGNVVPGVGINVNFGDGAPVSTPNAVSSSGPFWDAALWDDAIWPIEGAVTADWQTIGGDGNVVSVVVQVQTTETGSPSGVLLRLNSCDIMYERGGPLG